MSTRVHHDARSIEASAQESRDPDSITSESYISQSDDLKTHDATEVLQKLLPEYIASHIDGPSFVPAPSKVSSLLENSRCKEGNLASEPSIDDKSDKDTCSKQASEQDELEGDEKSSEEENDEAALGSSVQITNSLVFRRVLVRDRFLVQHGISILRYPTWKLPSTFVVQIQHNKWACSQKTPLDLDNRPAFLDHQLAYHGRWNMARCTIFNQSDNLQTVFELYRLIIAFGSGFWRSFTRKNQLPVPTLTCAPGL